MKPQAKELLSFACVAFNPRFSFLSEGLPQGIAWHAKDSFTNRRVSGIDWHVQPRSVLEPPPL
jgi:hypothetical protein